MKTIYILAYSWGGNSPEIKTFFSNEKAMMFLYDKLKGVYAPLKSYSKPIHEYIEEYENNIEPEHRDYDITCQIIQV